MSTADSPEPRASRTKLRSPTCAHANLKLHILSALRDAKYTKSQPPLRPPRLGEIASLVFALHSGRHRVRIRTLFSTAS
ncbi:hypothetical protein PYCCODRAFT_410849 [Trametes coccinea BRFM310]|uniref:Uncharacterized protein n=1 Tax=Trametes coccinea (strain BRFM310) TaxID=1353009 RepID=A0A1Y2INF1_TRAC3|nr:hypothetical protein PYCCODRAFT_410849 [Trametes coccinea BRFM310]